MIRRLEDWLLAMLQRRCDHPSHMVAVDILEGSGGDVAVGYCRRCGAVKPDFDTSITQVHLKVWRLPDPNLWRGRA